MADPKQKNIVDERWKMAVAPLKRDTRNYWINTSFVVGEQWITWSNTEQAIRRLEADPRRARITRNRIKRSLIINLAKILKNPLDFDVSPDSADDAAVKGAELAQTALIDVRDRRNWEQVRRAETMSTMIGGTAAVSIEWDPAGHKKVGTTENGVDYGVGEACLDALSIIEFAGQPGVEDAELGQWWVKQTAEDPDDVAERYGIDPPEPDATTAVGAWETRIVAAAATMSGATRSYDGRVMVRTLFERPSRKNPAGRVTTSVSGNIVQDVPWPFPWKDRLNLVVFRDFPMDGRWTGESRITDAIPIQTEINLARSVFADHLKKAGNARLWIPDTSIDEDDLTDDPGQPAFYNPIGGAHPVWATPPDMPQWEIQYPEQAASEIDDILGVHDVSRGEAPPGIEAGVALSVLAERDDTPLGLIARDQAEGWGRIGTMVLRLYERFLKAPGREMAVKPRGVVGATSPRPYAVDFTGEMLHGQTKATVPMEVMQPRSRAVQMAQASSLMQMGAFGTPPDLRLYVRVADLPDKDRLLAALSADADRAQRENEQMFRDQAAEIQKFDNHAVHISEHNWARKSERYERLSASEKNLFDVHVKAHETMAAEEAGRQEMKATESPALAAAAQADAPPGSGVPPAAAEALAAQQQGGMPGPAMPAQMPPEAAIPPPPAPTPAGVPQ
jgi:hypothetical protein